MLDSAMEKKVVKFRSFEEAEKADRDFYDKLTPQARLEILLELLNHGPEQRLERTYRVSKFARRLAAFEFFGTSPTRSDVCRRP